LSLNVPVGATSGTIYARFRCATATVSQPTGPAADGEVEDYAVTILTAGAVLDYGDAPDPGHPTLAGSNGAAHILSSGGPRLGACVDGEVNGQPTVAGLSLLR